MQVINKFRVCLSGSIAQILMILLCMLFADVPDAIAAQISVSTDRNPVSLEESFKIIFTANESPDEDPDFSPLEQDFEILSQSSSTNSSWINGKASKTIQWTLTVMAKQAGNLNIPVVKFGDDASQPMAVSVTQGSANKALNTDEELFLEVEVTPDNPFVQSQVIYTLKLFTRIDITQAKLNEPELVDAVIEKLGEDSNYNTQVNGVNYSVTERKYAIFPQKSGLMTIKPLTLIAEVLTGGRPNFSGFFSQQFTRTRRVESKAITLDVKPMPAEFNAKHWLSAEELHLKQEWSGDIKSMKVGEPITRTLTLLAKGTTVGQLPELNTEKLGDQVKAYPDQPVLQEQKKPEGLIAFREEKIALIPSKSGEYTLPAIEVPWFNTQSKKMEIAKIPETLINVAGTPGTQTVIKAPPVTNKDAPVKTEPLQPVQTQNQANIWVWISGALAFGWLTTLIYFLTSAPAKKPARQKKKLNLVDKQDSELKTTISNLKKACQDNHAADAKDNLILWGKQKFGTASLGEIASYCDAQLSNEILLLNQVLYGKNAVQWNGQKLFQAFSENKVKGKIMKAQDSSALEPLFRL